MQLKVILTRNRTWCSRRPKHWIPRRKTWYILRLRAKDIVVCYVPFRGFQARSVLRRGGALVDRLVVFAPPEFSMKKVQPGKQSSEGGASHLAAMETNVFAKLSSLAAHVAVTRYEDGTPRRPGWFTVKTLGAAWVVQVKDPDSCCQLQTTSQTLDDALALADLLLGSEEAPWEPDPWLQRTETQKKKKA